MSQPITGLAVATTYYWRVNGSNTLGTGPWSTEWSFVTIISAPEAPSLASPGNNAVLESTAPLLSWGAVAGAASYAVQLSTLSNFLSFNQDTATNVSTTFSGLAYNKYYWRVNAMNSLGISAWSTVWSFTTTAVSVLSTDAKALESSCYVRGSNLNYAMAQSGAVRISFSDILGRERAIINSQQSSGHYTCSLKTLNLSPGVYLMHFRAGTMEKRMKVMIH